MFSRYHCLVVCITFNTGLLYMFVSVCFVIVLLSNLFCFFGLFPIWGRRIEFSLSTLLGLVALLSVFVSHACIVLKHHSISFRLLSFGVNPLPSSMFSLRHLPQSFSPHGPTISVSLLLFSHLCLPHLPLLLCPHS